MDSMMQDVTRVGTAARAAALGRKDLAGKTGTTNDHVDAWFAGYQPGLVGVAWIGFDQPKKLGANETGALAALPIWMSYMRPTLKGVPESPQAVPEGIVSVRIDPETGLQAADGKLAEYFYREFIPADQPPTAAAEQVGARSTEEVRSQLY
jgi:penicillin-binding protein 1A